MSIKFFLIRFGKEHKGFYNVLLQPTVTNRDKKYFIFIAVLEKTFILLSSWLFSLKCSRCGTSLTNLLTIQKHYQIILQCKNNKIVWQGSLIVMKLQRILSWICISPSPSRSFIVSLCWLFSSPVWPQQVAVCREITQKNSQVETTTGSLHSLPALLCASLPSLINNINGNMIVTQLTMHYETVVNNHLFPLLRNQGL